MGDSLLLARRVWWGAVTRHTQCQHHCAVYTSAAPPALPPPRLLLSEGAPGRLGVWKWAPRRPVQAISNPAAGRLHVLWRRF